MKHALKQIVLTVTLCAVMAGCAVAPYTLVETQRRSVAGVYTVDPQLAWTSATTGKVEAWTVDGFLLHQVRFFSGMDDGDPLLRGGKDEDKRPRFRKTMTMREIVEFVVDSLYAGQTKLESLRPAPFGGAPGFRLELSRTTPIGVDVRVLAAGAVLKDRLYLIVYDAVALHYFPKYKPHVERLMESIQRQ